MRYETFIITPLLAIIVTIISLYIKSKIEQLRMQINFGYQLIKKRIDSLEDIVSYINKLYSNVIDLKLLYQNGITHPDDEKVKKLWDIVYDMSDQIRTKALFISKEHQSMVDEIVSGLKQAINSNDIVKELGKLHGLIKEFEKEIIKFVSDHIPIRERKIVNLRKGFKRIVWSISILAIIAGSIYVYYIGYVEGEFSSKPSGAGIRLVAHLDTKPKEIVLKEYDITKIEKDYPTLDIEMFKLRYTISPESGIDSVLWNKAVKAKPSELFAGQLPTGHIIITILLGLIPFIAIWLIWFLTIWIIQGFRG